MFICLWHTRHDLLLILCNFWVTQLSTCLEAPSWWTDDDWYVSEAYKNHVFIQKRNLSSSLRQEKFYKPLKEHVGLQDLGSVPGRGMQDLIWFSARYRNVGLNMVKFCPLISDIQIYLLIVKWTKTLKLYMYSITYHHLSWTFFCSLANFYYDTT